MAFPVVSDITETVFAVSSTQHLVDMPATVDPGDLLLLFFCNDGIATVTTPDGWALMDTAEAPNSNARFSVYYKIAVGDEDGTTVDFVTSVNEQAAIQLYRIAASSWHGTTPPAISSPSAATTATPDPPSLNPADWDVEDTLWLATYGSDDHDDATAYPTNYTDGTYNETWAGGGSCSIGTARRELAAASEDPSAFTIENPEQNVAYTVAIRPAADELDELAVIGVVGAFGLDVQRRSGRVVGY